MAMGPSPRSSPAVSVEDAGSPIQESEASHGQPEVHQFHGRLRPLVTVSSPECNERGISLFSIDGQYVHRIRRRFKPTLDDWPRGVLFLDKLINRAHLDVWLT